MNIKASMLCGCALSEENTVVGPWRMWLLRDVFTTQPRWVGAGGRSVAPAAASYIGSPICWSFIGHRLGKKKMFAR